MTLNDTFTSTGHKFFAHQEAMKNLRNGRGQPVVSHVMLTDVCNHSCAFCSVQARAGDSLVFDDVMVYLDILLRYGLKAVILSGGGNPILYKCKQTGKNFNDVVDAIHARGLEIGLITNGMPLKEYEPPYWKKMGFISEAASIVQAAPGSFSRPARSPVGYVPPPVFPRESWVTVSPETLDKLTWIRISMAGLDHEDNCVYVPDIDPAKTTLGFSYVAHDLWDAPEDPHHGKVSTEADLIALGGVTKGRKVWRFEDRISTLTDQLTAYVAKYKPKYLRALPNCLEPSLIPLRCEQLAAIAKLVNFVVEAEVMFVQQKPPKAPHACYLGYVHPVLNCDGYVYPCDSCVLNEAAGHAFANPWRICRWQDVAQIYEQPVRSLIADPKVTCPGCVFSGSNEILRGVVDGSADITPPSEVPTHVNFV